MLGQELDERLAQQKRESAMLSQRMDELDEIETTSISG